MKMKQKIKKAIIIGSFVICAYLIACWIDVIVHNNSDYKYGRWNVLSLIWSESEKEEKPVNTPTVVEVSESSTESVITTTEMTTAQISTTEESLPPTTTTNYQSEMVTEEVEVEESTIEEITTTEYIPEAEADAHGTTTVAEVASDSDAILNDDEVEMLAHLINGEAGADWCSDTTRYYVGSVVLNRVNHPEFPDTIAGVIWQSGQYACTWDGNYDLTPSDRCYEIARDLLENGSWLPSDVVFQANFSQGSGVYDYIDGVYFCYR